VPWRTARSARGQAHYPGYFWSAAMGTHVIYESRLELARLLLADFDRDVTAIAAVLSWVQVGTARLHGAGVLPTRAAAPEPHGHRSIGHADSPHLMRSQLLASLASASVRPLSRRDDQCRRSSGTSRC
jgi:hypothetical protein